MASIDQQRVETATDRIVGESFPLKHLDLRSRIIMQKRERFRTVLYECLAASAAAIDAVEAMQDIDLRLYLESLQPYADYMDPEQAARFVVDDLSRLSKDIQKTF